jgi:hypothetical protein
VDHHDTARLPSSDCGAQRRDGELRGHSFVDRVADDPVAEQVLDRAAVELALGRGVLGDVGDPDGVGCVGGEVALDVVVVHRRSGRLAAAAPALADRARPQALLGAQPPDPSFANDVAGSLELVGQEPVAELRVVVVGIDQGVGQVGVVQLALADGPSKPRVVRLGRVADTPQVNRTGTPSAARSRTSG